MLQSHSSMLSQASSGQCTHILQSNTRRSKFAPRSILADVGSKRSIILSSTDLYDLYPERSLKRIKHGHENCHRSKNTNEAVCEQLLRAGKRMQQRRSYTHSPIITDREHFQYSKSSVDDRADGRYAQEHDNDDETRDDEDNDINSVESIDDFWDGDIPFNQSRPHFAPPKEPEEPKESDESDGSDDSEDSEEDDELDESDESEESEDDPKNDPEDDPDDSDDPDDPDESDMSDGSDKSGESEEPDNPGIPDGTPKREICWWDLPGEVNEHSFIAIHFKKGCID
jgi:hypothetical protein